MRMSHERACIYIQMDGKKCFGRGGMATVSEVRGLQLEETNWRWRGGLKFTSS